MEPKTILKTADKRSSARKALKSTALKIENKKSTRSFRSNHVNIPQKQNSETQGPPFKRRKTERPKLEEKSRPKPKSKEYASIIRTKKKKIAITTKPKIQESNVMIVLSDSDSEEKTVDLLDIPIIPPERKSARLKVYLYGILGIIIF